MKRTLLFALCACLLLLSACAKRQPATQSAELPKAAQDAADAYLGAKQAKLGSGYGKLQVVYAHDFQALRVDDLAVHEVACKQHLVGLQIAEADIVRFDLQGEAVVVEFVDVLAP